MILVNVTIASNNIQTSLANIGDTVTVFFTSDQDIVNIPVVTIAGKSALVSGEGKTWNAKYTLTSDDSVGKIAFTIDVIDSNGVSCLQVSSTTLGDQVIFKKSILSVSVIKKILVISIAVLLVVFLVNVYSFIMNKNTPKITLDQASLDKKVLQDDLLAQKKFLDNSTTENQDEYIKESLKMLNDNTITPFTKNLLRLRRAIVLSTLKGSSNQDAYVTEATKIFKDFILDENTDTGSVYLKDFSIVAGVKLHSQCCFTAKLTDSDFKSYTKYKSMGYSDTVANLLTLNDISKMVSKERYDDISNITNKFGIEIDLLMKNKKNISNETYKQIYRELGENLEVYKKSKAILFTDPANTFLRPTTHYAVAYDVYYSQSGTALTPEVNKKIDENYDLALSKIDTAESLASNKPLINEMRVYLLIGYINSLEQRYGEAVDKNKRDLLVKSFLKSVKSSKETEVLFGKIFKQSVISPDFKSSVAYNLFALYKYYPELNSYLKSLGIEKGGIE